MIPITCHVVNCKNSPKYAHSLSIQIGNEDFLCQFQLPIGWSTYSFEGGEIGFTCPEHKK